MSDKTKKNAWWQKQKNVWWPDVSTPAAARSARMYGVWAAVFSAVVTALLASWSLGSGKAAFELVDAWSFLDVAIFVAVAFGIYKESRFAAVAGLVIFVGEKLYQPVVSTTPTPGTSGIIVAFFLTICYVAAIRGTYALRRFPAESPRADIPILQDRVTLTAGAPIRDSATKMMNRFLVVIAVALLVAAAMICTLFRYEVTTDNDGAIRGRYDRWTGNVEFRLPYCSNRRYLWPLRWGQLYDPDPPSCEDPKVSPPPAESPGKNDWIKPGQAIVAPPGQTPKSKPPQRWQDGSTLVQPAPSKVRPEDYGAVPVERQKPK
jgi:hypothetical protein